jgi:hypothetical protein
VKMRTPTILLALGIAVATLTGDALSERCWTKFHAIETGQARRGATVVFTPAELNAWIQVNVPQMAEGISNPRVQLETGAATGTAMVDFVKLRKAKGSEPSSFFAMLFEGERPLKVSASLESSQGRATVHLTSVELAGINVSGTLLDYLVKNFLLPQFPEAKINQPFELRDNMERIEIQPDAVRVSIRK